MFSETDLTLPDGRTLHVYDTGGPGLPVLWQHGTPNIGAPPVPLFAAAERLGLRWVGHDRPGYGGSSPQPGRTVAAVAADVAAVADALGIDRFAVMGHSGGGPHALACGALLPDRVSPWSRPPAPRRTTRDGLDFFAGMAEAGVALDDRGRRRARGTRGPRGGRGRGGLRLHRRRRGGARRPVELVPRRRCGRRWPQARPR